MTEGFQSKIKSTFNVSTERAAKLYKEMQQCMKRKDLITIFRCTNGRGEKSPAELDEMILTALFKAQHLHPSEQLSLALTWNRSDIAKKEIFTYGQDWPDGVLDNAMQEALELDRVDFVRLLLDQGVNMAVKWLCDGLCDEACCEPHSHSSQPSQSLNTSHNTACV